MIELNLLPEELRKKETPKFVLPEIPIQKALTIFLSVFFGAQILVSLFAFYEKIDLESTKKAAAALAAANHDLALHKTETGQLRNRLKEIHALIVRPFYWSSLLNGVSDAMIKGVWLTALSVTDVTQLPRGKRGAKSVSQSAEGPAPSAAAGKGRAAANLARALKLEGSVMSRGDETAYIGKFIKELKSNPRLAALFTDIDLSDINQKKIKEFDVYDFVLVCVFNRDKASATG